MNFWGLGIGDWGLGIGDWAQSPIPNPQSPCQLINYILLNKNIIYFSLFYSSIKFKYKNINEFI